MSLWLLIDPLGLALLVRNDLALLEPQSDLLLGVLDTVGAVADVAADVLFNRLAPRNAVCEVDNLQWRNHHGWCRGWRPEGWWHQGELQLRVISIVIYLTIDHVDG